MLKRAHYLLSAVLLVALGSFLLPSCTDLLGINTDHNENLCNNEVERPDPIECGKGKCHVFMDFCDDNGLPQKCEPGAAQETELCPDGIDNDCNGQVDENVSPDCKCTVGVAPKSCFSGSAAEQGHGLCHDGVQACQNGSWGPCTGDVLPSKELPDGFDNDCDNEVDEDFECEEGAQQYCYTGPKETLHDDNPSVPCKRGIQVCTSDGKWGDCQGDVLPALEECDGIDNDCTGVVDDVPGGSCVCIPDTDCYTGPKATKDVGACKSGKAKCANGELVECVGEVLPTPEVCDGIDHDCNGVIDNFDKDDPQPPCVCAFLSERECYTGNPPESQDILPCKAGTQKCVKGKWAACNDEVIPKTEACNNLDDDCNGLVDDTVPGVGLDCVVDGYLPNSACAAGKKQCDPATMMPVCVSIVQPNSKPEAPCDNQDDDCNGIVDDGPFCCFGDGTQNGNETDVDCGGKCDTKCTVGKHCNVAVDCESLVCVDTVCFPDSCGDMVQNGDETDLNCGGGSCPKCAQDKKCLIDADCISNVCDPNSKKCAKKPIGDPCVLANECQTSYCVDGFCCQEQCNGTCQACSATKKGGGANGFCGSIPVGADPDEECGTQDPSTCGTTGFCDGAGACQKYPNNTTCLAASCADGTTVQKAKTCNGSGACIDNGTQSCMTYTCAAGVCKNICGSDADCAATAYCNVPNCLAKKPLGTPCGQTKECASGNCVDGVCCDTACAGICQACIASKKGAGGGIDGTCGPIAVSTDPDTECNDQGSMTCGTTGNCDGAGACQKYQPGTQCQAASCANATTLNKASQCMGGGLPCPAPMTQDCTPYICATVAGNSNCKSMCAVDSDCATGYYCNGQSCLAKKVLGVSCGLDHECNSNFCANNVCCNTACSGECKSCLAAEKGAGSDGICGDVAANTDPQNDCNAELVATCGLTGECNGAGACQKYAANTVCTPASCSGVTLTPQKQCDGVGNCVGPANTSCAPYQCIANACPNTCVNDAQCANGNYCMMSSCVAKKVIGALCIQGSECASGSCADGVCCDSACVGTCQACNNAGSVGTCVNVPNGNSDTGTCNSPSICIGGVCKKSNGTMCSAASECASSNCVDNICCGSASCGTCQACNVSGSLGTCADVTAGQPDPGTCDAPNACTGGLCKKGPGQTCGSAGECQSGNCVDGVCCSAATCGTCQACNISGSLGTCANVANGASDAGTCDSPNTCTSGVCKKANGQLCGGAGDCQSGNCIDGVCCNSTCTGTCQACNVMMSFGTCTNVTTGTSDPGTCDSPNTCTAGTCKKANGQTCGGGSDCQSNNCVDGVCCGSASCGTCQSCNVSGFAGTCTNVPDGNSDAGTCNSPSTCTGGVCKKINGQTCGGAADCQSGNCVDGVCCGSAACGTCQSCNVSGFAGTCTNIANGTSDADTCANPNTCTAGVCKKVNGQMCGGAGDCQSGNCVDGVCCGSASCGTCQACNLSGSGTCTNIANGTSDPGTCESPSTCTAGVCKKINGQTCGGAGECQSGNCVDGVCCGTASCGTCQSCNVSGSQGTCANVANGTSDPGTCTSPNTCTAGVCKKVDGQTCGGAGDCQSGNCVDGVCCNVASCGTCQACNISGSGTCANVANGTSDADTCANPNTCNAGVCKKTNGQTCAGGSGCQSGNCVDGVCCNVASCGTCQACNISGSGTCANVASGPDPDTCATPNTCAAGVCKEPNGSMCAGAGECQSGNCADGFCCDTACTGTCQACNVMMSIGMCTNVPNGTSDALTCISPNICQAGACKKANGALCSGDAECLSDICSIACKATFGQSCSNNAECASNDCSGGPPKTCQLGGAGSRCASNADCMSDVCTGVPESCAPGATGKPCVDNADCASNVCTGNLCE